MFFALGKRPAMPTMAMPPLFFCWTLMPSPRLPLFAAARRLLVFGDHGHGLFQGPAACVRSENWRANEWSDAETILRPADQNRAHRATAPAPARRAVSFRRDRRSCHTGRLFPRGEAP